MHIIICSGLLLLGIEYSDVKIKGEGSILQRFEVLTEIKALGFLKVTKLDVEISN